MNSKTMLALLSMAVLSCSPNPPAADPPAAPPSSELPPASIEIERFTADIPLAPSGQQSALTQRDSTHWSPPTNSSAAIEKRVPQTLYRLSPAAKRWASLEDYQRWLVEFLENGKHPLDFYSGHVKHLDPAIFEIQPGDTVADIGCGTGTLEMSLLAKEVAFKKLYGVDIDKESLDFLAFALHASKLDPERRVELVHSSLVDVQLPENSIDVILVLFTRLMPPSASDRSVHGNADFNQLFTTIKKALKPGATFHMIDSMGNENTPVPDGSPRALRNYAPKHVIGWMTELGFELTSQSELSESALGEQNYHLAFRFSN